jgi:signal transduction histidine kinase
MSKEKRTTETSDNLRRLAEQMLPQGEPGRVPQGDAEARRVLHELEVHQIELEMQNAELRQSREETEQALERYTDLYDFAPLGYFTLNPELTVRASNLAGASLLGVERSRLLGRSFLSFVASSERGAFSEFLDRVFAGTGKQELELELAPLLEGSPRLFARVVAVPDAAGGTCRMAVVDITKRKLAEEELDRYREQLEFLVAERTRSLETEIVERKRAELAVKELNAGLERRVLERTDELQSTIRDLQTFSYSVSHDLRAPLRSINSFASLLLEDFGELLGGEGRRLLDTIVLRTVNMGRLIDDLLSFSKNSRQQLALQPIDLTGLVRELVEKLSGEGGAGAVEFSVAQLPPALGARAMIAQALENLLSNAVKFSRMVARPRVEVGCLEQEGENVYFVTDNGVGFDMKFASTIFGVFQRLHNDEEFEGTGVGLAIVEQIIARHGGRVWAEGRPGAGATFFFTLGSR